MIGNTNQVDVMMFPDRASGLFTLLGERAMAQAFGDWLQPVLLSRSTSVVQIEAGYGVGGKVLLQFLHSWIKPCLLIHTDFQ